MEGAARNEFPFNLILLINDINDLVFYVASLAFLFPRLDPALRRHAAMLEAVGLVTSLHDMAVIGQTVQ